MTYFHHRSRIDDNVYKSTPRILIDDSIFSGPRTRIDDNV